jgi:hypothetical protein
VSCVVVTDGLSLPCTRIPVLVGAHILAFDHYHHGGERCISMLNVVVRTLMLETKFTRH